MNPIVCLISGIATFLVVLALFLDHDLKRWKDNQPVDHGGKTVLRRLPLQLPSVTFFSLYAMNWWAIPVSYLVLNTAWWFFFDGIYNISRKKKWFYNGSFNDPGHTDAWTDKLLRKMKPWQQALLKLSLIAGSIYWYTTLIK